MAILKVSDHVAMRDETWTRKILKKPDFVPKYIREFFLKKENRKNLRRISTFELLRLKTEKLKAGFCYRIHKLAGKRDDYGELVSDTCFRNRRRQEFLSKYVD